MSGLHFSEEQIVAYQEKYCSLSDVIYQLGIYLFVGQGEASAFVRSTYQHILKNLPEYLRAADPKVELLKVALENKVKDGEKVAFFLCDIQGLDENIAADILHLPKQDLLKLVAAERRVRIHAQSSRQTTSPNLQPFFELIGGYLDESLGGQDTTKVEEFLKDEQNGKLLEDFRELRGRQQNALGQMRTPATITADIRHLVENSDQRTKTEMKRIELIEKKQFKYDLLRRFLLLGLTIALITTLYYFLKPHTTSRFPSLEYLGYETLAIEEDPGRLDLPTKERNDVEQFLKAASPGLKFAPKVLKPFGQAWSFSGVSLIDYEVMKVIAVKYENSEMKDSLIHYMMGGTLADLPKAEKVRINQLEYVVFANDRLNFVAWQMNDSTVSILVGRRGAVDLAKFALDGSF